MRHVMLRLALCLASCAVFALPAAAAPAFHKPTPGNQFVTITDKYLYVVWSVPRDLQPFAGIETREQLEAFVARSALLLCKAHIAKEPTRSKECKVQVVRLNSNDEYTKSAAGGFKTIATLIAPLSQISDELVARVEQGLSLTALRPLFRKFNFVHEEITMGAK
jgi:hypothetical protein